VHVDPVRVTHAPFIFMTFPWLLMVNRGKHGPIIA
jgi:hypothetical protein